MEAVILMGVQGAGKTTFCSERFADTHVRISLDVLRTRNREQKLFLECLTEKRPFVVDNTNPSARDRARYIGAAKDAGFRVVGYFLKTDLRDAITRNKQREGRQKVPVPAVVSTFKKMEQPTFEEGFDELFGVEVVAGNGFVVQRLENV
jgi:predicted kinase